MTKTLDGEIRKVVEYADQYIYQSDDLLDMMNGQMANPGENPEHSVRVPEGRWICYYLVDHPIKGRCHYFQIKTDARGKFSGKPELEYIVNEFGYENRLLDEQIKIDETNQETRIILPINN